MMFKWYHKFVCSMVMCFVLPAAICGCKHTETNVSDNTVNKKSVAVKKLNIDTDDYLGISGEWFYYMPQINYNSDICDHEIMRYNLKTDEIEKIGEIAKLSTWSGVVAFVNDDKIYGTFGVMENGEYCNIHIQIDSKSREVTVLSKDNNFPPLIQNIAVNNDCFVEYQPIKTESGYRYVLRVVDVKSGESKEIVTRERRTGGSGEMIVDASVYDGVIYTFEYDEDIAYVCSYDLSGKQLSKENIKFIDEFLNKPDEITGNTETMSDIDVINGYYFFASLNGQRLVLHKTDKGWEKREDLIMNRIGGISNLINDLNSKQSDYTKVLLYDYNTQELSYLDTETGKKIKLNLDLQGATYCMTDGKQLLFFNENKELCYIEDVFAK